MEIKILGPGCANCQMLLKNAMDALHELTMEANIEKVTDYKEILSYGVMSTPGLVIDGKVAVSGRVPSKDEIKEILQKSR